MGINKISHFSYTIIIVTIVFVSITLTGCINNTDKIISENIISEEDIGGKYDAKLVTIEVSEVYDNPKEGIYEKFSYNIYEIHYSIDGKKYIGYWDPKFKESIDWIKQNTPDDSIFLNSWDFGHLIRGGTGRNVVTSRPSKELWNENKVGFSNKIDKKTYENEYGGFESSERIKDVSLALATDDIAVTNQIMDKYNAKYIFLTMEDLAYFDYMVIDGDYTDYYTTVEISGEQKTVPNQMLYNSTLSKLMLFNGKDLKDYRLVYKSKGDPFSISSKIETDYKDAYNSLYSGNLKVENGGYIKIFEYIKET